MPRPSRASSGQRWILGALAAVAYAVASHLAMTLAGHSPAALALVLGPLVTVGLCGLWAGGHRALALAAGLAAAGIAAMSARGGALDPHLLYLAQHAGAHLALGAWFGTTLRAGRQPLISSLAARLHGGLTPALATYTRHVTQVWTGYFLLMVALSLGLFFGADFDRWSMFANLVTPVSAVALFTGEYLLRYRLHPEFERVSLADGLRAYRAHGNAPAREQEAP
ncbi:MAG TPA: hypothetical protein VFE82_15925 [Ramlibacter sp.]|jgi:uncharacterized membrane protein|uniref:hypothetical protein n=1 Tax=Ramlibacter sp. TaxID=1917967 RepID=UPI002D6F2981|nr:hypothetical protein [Ramlibacter sp.]HZY19960.1 hypothetical protein [Ramlibacter sp.]